MDQETMAFGISVILQDAPEDVTRFLVNVSFEATKTKTKKRAK